MDSFDSFGSGFLGVWTLLRVLTVLRGRGGCADSFDKYEGCFHFLDFLTVSTVFRDFVLRTILDSFDGF